MTEIDTPYEDLLRDVLENGTPKGDRTGTGTRSVFGRQIRYDLAEGFPLITTKKVHLKSVVYELLFFLHGETNVRWLQERGVKIWDDWADVNGNLGPIYSHQWRKFGGRPANRPQPGPKLESGLSATVHGVGSRGLYIHGENPVDDRLLNTWKGMIARCYSSNKDTYPYYGGKGVFVCDSWLNFDNFRADVKSLPGWELKASAWDEYQLDKDTVGDGFKYSPETCAWVTRATNMRAKGDVTYTLMHTDGRVETVGDPTLFRLEYGISQGNFSAMLRGERSAAGGWSLVGTRDNRGGVDQIAKVVEQIRTNPDSRRHVVTAWNPAEVDDMALPPCHALFQFYVADGKLSCQLYQRSADLFLGVPFNIASYALLTHMVAAQAGLEVGEFVWTGGDCHVYDNHVEQVRTQLERDPYPYPSLRLAPRESIFDYEFEDVEVLGYVSHPTIKAPIAV